MKKNKKTKQNNLSYLKLILLIVFLIILVYLSFKIFRSSDITSSKSKRVVSSNTSKQYSSTANSNNQTQSNNTQTPPIQPPSGQLLNVRVVSLTSGPGLESICQSITNATCTVRITKASVVKNLTAQNTGDTGIVIFEWNAASIGLTPGQWTIEAVVTQNSKSAVSHKEFLEVTK